MNTTRRGFLGGLLALAAVPLAKAFPKPQAMNVRTVTPDDGPWLKANVWGTPPPLTEARLLRAMRYRQSERYYIGGVWPGGVQWPR